MSFREKLTVWVAALLLTGLVALLLRHEARFQVVSDAARRLARQEVQLAQAGSEEMAGYRAARGEILPLMESGDFGAAGARLRSLDDGDAVQPADSGKPVLSVDQLWRAGSPERTAAAGVLQRLVERQKAGYDVEPAQQILWRVASAARAGNRDLALRTWAEVAPAVDGARLRPGFQAVEAPPAALQIATPTGLPQVQRLMEQVRRVRDEMIPMAMRETHLGPAEQSFLRRMQAFCDELLAALRAGKDIRSAEGSLRELAQAAFEERDVKKAEELLKRSRAALAAAPVLPRAAWQMAAADIPRALAGRRPPPPSATPERIMEWLDELRRAPDPEYARRRDAFARNLARLLGGAGHGGAGPSAVPAPATGGGPARTSYGTGLRLVAGPAGQFYSLAAGKRVLGFDEGGLGWCVSVPSPGGAEPVVVPIPFRPAGEGRFGFAAGAGQVEARVLSRENELRLALKAVRSQETMQGSLLLRLPLALGGWKVLRPGSESVLAVERPVSAEVADVARTLQFSDGEIDLTLTFPGASAASAVPARGWVQAEYPLPSPGGMIEHVVTLRVGQRRQP